MKKTVLLGMSGGVDSSTSAVLLKEQGYEVTGITFHLYEGGCCNLDSTMEAKQVCKKLGIEHVTLDYKDYFQDTIIKNFIEEYQSGRTPNPCVLCNKLIKFGIMYEKAKEMGIDYIATGHYAKCEFNEKYNQHVISKSANIAKDQTYFLWEINKEILPHILFPLGNFENKEEVREIARKNDLVSANKRDSEDICFITNGDYKDFLEKNANMNSKAGNIVDKNGKVLGNHNGIYNYTVGQRKGLNISYSEPLFVTKIDVTKNEVVIGTRDDLYQKSIVVSNLNWQIEDDFERVEALVKTRYSKNENKAIITKMDENKAMVEFDEPVLNISPGQSAVFYDASGIVLGGGIIA